MSEFKLLCQYVLSTSKRLNIQYAPLIILLVKNMKVIFCDYPLNSKIKWETCHSTSDYAFLTKSSQKTNASNHFTLPNTFHRTWKEQKANYMAQIPPQCSICSCFSYYFYFPLLYHNNQHLKQLKLLIYYAWEIQ